MPKTKAIKLRRGLTETEDHIANHAYILPKMKLLPELSVKLSSPDRITPGNALTIIRNLLEPDYSAI